MEDVPNPQKPQNPVERIKKLIQQGMSTIVAASGSAQPLETVLSAPNAMLITNANFGRPEDQLLPNAGGERCEISLYWPREGYRENPLYLKFERSASRGKSGKTLRYTVEARFSHPGFGYAKLRGAILNSSGRIAWRHISTRLDAYADDDLVVNPTGTAEIWLPLGTSRWLRDGTRVQTLADGVDAHLGRGSATELIRSCDELIGQAFEELEQYIPGQTEYGGAPPSNN